MISLANLKVDLGITGTDNDAYLTRLIAKAQSIIEGYCNRTFAAADYVEEYKGSGTQYLNLKNYPIRTLTKVERNDGTVASPTLVNITSDVYALNSKGQLHLQSGFFAKEREYKVTYSAGYTTIPADLEGACSDLVSVMFANQNKQGLESERLGEYSYKLKAGDDLLATSGVKGILDRYRTPNA